MPARVARRRRRRREQVGDASVPGEHGIRSTCEPRPSTKARSPARGCGRVSRSVVAAPARRSRRCRGRACGRPSARRAPGRARARCAFSSVEQCVGRERGARPARPRSGRRARRGRRPSSLQRGRLDAAARCAVSSTPSVAASVGTAARRVASRSPRLLPSAMTARRSTRRSADAHARSRGDRTRDVGERHRDRRARLVHGHVDARRRGRMREHDGRDALGDGLDQVDRVALDRGDDLARRARRSARSASRSSLAAAAREVEPAPSRR